MTSFFGDDRDVDALRRGREDVVERLVDRVGEDVGARDQARRRAPPRSRSGPCAACGPAARGSEGERGVRRHRLHQLAHLVGVAGVAVVHDLAVDSTSTRSADRRPRAGRGSPSRRSGRTRRRRGAGARAPRRTAFESRLPVGSSANTTAGRVMSARATATRCCWPPESSEGRWVRRSLSPTVSISCVEPGLVGRLAPGDPQRQRDVLLGREHREQVEELEDEAELVAAQLREPLVVELRDVDAARRLDRAPGRPVETGEDVHERRLPGARRAHDRGEASLREADGHAAAARRRRRRPRRSGAGDLWR